VARERAASLHTLDEEHAAAPTGAWPPALKCRRHTRQPHTLATLALEDGIEFEADSIRAVCARFEPDIR